MTLKSFCVGLALASAAVLPQAARAKDCFILVHGHTDVDATEPGSTKAFDYWKRDFIKNLTSNFVANYGVVKWDASDASANAFWEPVASKVVAQQILQIASGLGDSFPGHEHQCESGDRAFVVAHSQGAQVLTYIDGNAYQGAPYYNASIVADTQSQIASATLEAAPFSEAMAKVTAIFSLGGAINGTEGMDEYCQLASSSTFSGVFKRCIPSLQTYAQFNPRTYTGSTLLKPMYALGGWSHLDGVMGATSMTLDGQDDGVVNLASQMNCAGSPQRDLEEDLTERGMWNDIKFRCNRYNKRHTSNSFNLASIDLNHEEERDSTGASFPHASNGQDVLTCGGNKDMAGTIASCISSLPSL